MKFFIGTAYYFLLLGVTLTSYLGFHLLVGFVLYSRFIFEEKFENTSFIIKTIIGGTANTSPDIFGIEIAAIMGSGYLVYEVTDKYLNRDKIGNYALLGVVISVVLYFITVFVTMIMGNTNYSIFEYLLVIFAPILFILPFGSKY